MQKNGALQVTKRLYFGKKEHALMVVGRSGDIRFDMSRDF